ncbi:MAG TPA: hypothetical protein VK759_01615 [Rhizomicrobium sp.]|nr:hypothetical protein [Rhizomicrobium sp.]
MAKPSLLFAAALAALLCGASAAFAQVKAISLMDDPKPAAQPSTPADTSGIADILPAGGAANVKTATGLTTDALAGVGTGALIAIGILALHSGHGQTATTTTSTR